MAIPGLYPLFLVTKSGSGLVVGAEIAVLVSNELVSAVNAGNINVSLPSADITVNMQNDIKLVVSTTDIVVVLSKDLITEIN